MTRITDRCPVAARRLTPAVVLVAAMAATTSFPSYAAIDPCTTQEAKAAMDARKDAAQRQADTVAKEMENTVARPLGELGNDCIKGIADAGLGARMSYGGLGGIMDAATNMGKKMASSMCRMVAGKVQSEIDSAVSENTGVLGQAGDVLSHPIVRASGTGVDVGSQHDGVTYNGAEVVPGTRSAVDGAMQSNQASAASVPRTTGRGSNESTTGGLINGLYR